MKLFCLFFLQMVSVLLFSQVNPGPHISALGATGVVAQGVWSLQANQAGLATIKRPIFSGAFERKYMDPDLNTKSVVIAYPFKKNVFGLSFQSYGFSAYNEQRIGLAYAKSFGNSIYASLNFNYHQVKISQYGSAQAFSIEAGLQYQATEKLLIGAHIANPNKGMYQDGVDATIPVISEFGVAYRFTDKFQANTAVVKALNSAADARFGIEYNLAEWLVLRGGFATNPIRQYSGFGFTYNQFTLDFAVSSHPNLGYSPQMALTYEF